MTDAGPAVREDGIGTDLRRIITEVSREARRNKTPVYIAALAASLALVSMAEDEASRRALSAHIESTNQFAYFQAKNIRQTDSEIAALTFENMGQGTLATQWRERADRYEKEKSEILAAARQQQEERQVSILMRSYFEVALALLQISIVLASASLILGGGGLLVGSAILALLAVGLTVNGYGLFVEFPTDPVAFGQWLVGAGPAEGP